MRTRNAALRLLHYLGTTDPVDLLMQVSNALDGDDWMGEFRITDVLDHVIDQVKELQNAVKQLASDRADLAHALLTDTPATIFELRRKLTAELQRLDTYIDATWASQDHRTLIVAAEADTSPLESADPQHTLMHDRPVSGGWPDTDAERSNPVIDDIGSLT